MKSYFLPTALVSLTIFFFTGCFTSTNSNDNFSDIAQQTFDQQAYTQAIQDKNAGLCATLYDQNLRNECEGIIKNEQILSEATKSLDVKECEPVSDAKYKELCVAQIKSIIDAGHENEKLQSQVDEDVNKMQEIVKNGDLAACKNLKAADIDACESNIITPEAMNQLNDSLCEKLSNKEFIGICKDNVALAKAQSTGQKSSK